MSVRWKKRAQEGITVRKITDVVIAIFLLNTACHFCMQIGTLSPSGDISASKVRLNDPINP